MFELSFDDTTANTDTDHMAAQRIGTLYFSARLSNFVAGNLMA